MRVLTFQQRSTIASGVTSLGPNCCRSVFGCCTPRGKHEPAIETTPLVSAYAAAKAAVVSLTRSASLEGAAKGIRVNAVLPGAVNTPMLWENPNVKSGLEKIDRGVLGQPEDLAAVIAFLASDEAEFVRGSSVIVDGGRLGKL